MAGPGRRAVACALPALLAGCSAAPVPIARLPYDPSLGFADPARQAIIHTAAAFAAPDTLAGRPWEAAEAISQAEFLAVELRYAPRWIEMMAAPQAFIAARPEWRAALGIDQDAPPQAVIDALTGVRLAFGAENPAAAAAALPQPLFARGGEATLRGLSALPPLPGTAWAASLALREMWRIQRQGSWGNDWE